MNTDHVSDDQNKIQFGKLVSSKRKQKRMSLKTVAKHCGVTLNFISLIERGIKSPSDKVIVKLSEILDIDEYILFQALDRIPPSVKSNVALLLYKHEGLKELLGELSDKVADESMRNDLYDEVYEVYRNFLKRNKLDE